MLLYAVILYVALSSMAVGLAANSAVNTSADPCDNFYEFTCGNYSRSVEIPPYKSSTGFFSEQMGSVRRELSSILAEPVQSEDNKAFRLAKQFYSSCMDTTRLEEEGSEPARGLLKSLGGWPLLSSSWDEDHLNWTQLVFQLRNKGLDGGFLLNVKVTGSIKPSVAGGGVMTSRTLVQVVPPQLNLDVRRLDAKTIQQRIDEYASFITDVAILLGGGDFNTSRVHSEAAEVASFEASLSKLMTENVVLTSLSKLQVDRPELPWGEYLASFLAPGFQLRNQPIAASTYALNLAKDRLLDTTPKRTVANYLLWRALHGHVLTRLDAAARTLLWERGGGNVVATKERWMQCTLATQESMRAATSAMYARRYMPRINRTAIDGVVRAIVKSAMDSVTTSSSWLNMRTSVFPERSITFHSQLLRHQAKSLKLYIGHVEELTNDSTLDKYYREVDIDGESFLGKTLLLSKNALEFILRKSKEPHDLNIPENTPADVVGAFYDRAGTNSLVIPLGTLLHYNSSLPRNVMYARLDFIIAHEVAHALSAMDLYTDDLSPAFEDSTAPKSRKEFFMRKECIKEQYDNATNEELHINVNGNVSFVENLADVGGLKIAYAAYRASQLELGLPKDEKAADIKALQSFWVSFAQMFCEKYTLKRLEQVVRWESHLPGVHRVNGAVKNQPEFSADFACPSDAAMNPPRRCTLW